jgi:hypothetical protein
LAGARWAAAQAPTIVRVEEDWELVVGIPDPDRDAPQITTVISPQGDCSGVYAAVDVNHQSLPEFSPGGLQLQIWRNGSAIAERRFPNASVLSQAGETIRWTQAMELTGGVLTFEVVHGSSTTWGNFGGEGYLRAHVSTSLGSLNGYSPNVSVENSGVSYADNRVTSLTIKRVRYYTSSGQVVTDETERVIHRQ